MSQNERETFTHWNERHRHRAMSEENKVVQFKCFELYGVYTLGDIVVVIMVVREAVISSLTSLWPSQQGTHVGHHEHEATPHRLWTEGNRFEITNVFCAETDWTAGKSYLINLQIMRRLITKTKAKEIRFHIKVNKYMFVEGTNRGDLSSYAQTCFFIDVNSVQ